MPRLLAVDDPAYPAADFDPLLRLIWVNGDGIECEAVIVGVVATALVKMQAVAGPRPVTLGTAELLTVARYKELYGRRLDVGDDDRDLKVPSYGKRLLGALTRFWLQVV